MADVSSGDRSSGRGLALQQELSFLRLLDVLADIASHQLEIERQRVQSQSVNDACELRRTRGSNDGSREPTGVGQRLLRVADAAQVLKIGRSSVYALCARGELPVVRVGRAVRIPAQELQRWIDEKTEPSLRINPR